MPTHIADIDLDAPLAPLAVPTGTTGVLALVRRAGRPTGLLRLRARERIDVPSLQQAIAAQIAAPERAHSPAAPCTPLSIIVCTHERPADLERCLSALDRLAAQGHDIIVVDNAPHSTRSAHVAARHACRYLCEPRRGLDRARTAGLLAATHAIVAYTDDDAAPDAGWANALAAPFADPAVGCVTGLVLPVELATPAQESFEVYCAHRRTFTRGVFDASHTPPATAGVVGMGANMALRRTLALQLGGFDPRLDAGTRTCSGGDTDMFARVLDAGKRIVYTPEALVWHRHRRELSALYQCIFGYGVGLYAFLTKRLLEARDAQAAITAARWFVGPLVKAAARRLRGQRAVAFDLLQREAAGALLGPRRFLIEARNAQRLKEQWPV